MLNPEIAKALDAVHGEIAGHFLITGTPEGGAPLAVRQQWIGEALPIRRLYVERFLHGYIGRRMLPVPEDFAREDAISGEPLPWKSFPVEIRGHDAVNTLIESGKLAVAEFWKPYEDALFSFNHWEGQFVDLQAQAQE